MGVVDCVHHEYYACNLDGTLIDKEKCLTCKFRDPDTNTKNIELEYLLKNEIAWSELDKDSKDKLMRYILEAITK